MAMKTILLFLLISISAFSQKKMVLIEGFHQVNVEDSITGATVERFAQYMERSTVDYEEALRKTRAIKMVDKDRYFVSEFKDGILYLNSRLNDFPYTKQAVILQHLAVQNGMETQKGHMPAVYNRDFNITDHNEKIFEKQLTGRRILYLYLVRILEKQSPLRR